MKNYDIAVIKGDGIGPEVTDEAIKVLDAVASLENFSINYNEFLMGSSAVDVFNDALPQDTIEGCKKANAVLVGAIDNKDFHEEKPISRLKKELEVLVSIRPIRAYEPLLKMARLKEEQIKGLNLLLFKNSKYSAKNLQEEIAQIASIVDEFARSQNHKITLVDKVYKEQEDTLWSSIFKEKISDELTLEFCNAREVAERLLVHPNEFDILVLRDNCGEILASQAFSIGGNYELLPTAYICQKTNIFTPLHGVASLIAGQGIANPIATILSAALMLRYSLNESNAANRIEKAVEKVINEGFHTKDMILDNAKDILTTSEMGAQVANYL